MSGHPLTSVSRHYPYKERLVDMVGDSMRALLLESLGYRVNVFEFVASEQTPKNVMLRATKNAVRKQDQEAALGKYNELVTLFGFSPALEKILTSGVKNETLGA